VFWIPVLALSVVVNLELRRRTPQHSAVNDPSSSAQLLVFGTSVLVLALLLCVFGPAMLYFSDPLAYFNQGVDRVIGSSLPIMGLILLAALIIWTTVPRRGRNALCKLSSFCALASLLFASSGFPDYGVIDGFNLSRFNSVTPSVKALVDITTLGVAALITLALFKYKGSLEIVAYFVVLSIALVVYPCVLSITHKVAPETTGTGQLQTALKYSKSGKNTVIFILDMFTGTHIKQLIEDLPETMMKFTGFTWYPDTLAAGNITLLGIPPIVGGHSYVPSQMNKNSDSTNVEKLTQAHTLLPRSFAESGSETSLLNVPFYLDKTIFLKQLGDAGKNLHFFPNATEIIYPPNKKDTESRLYSIALSLFRMSPNLLRGSIYQGGMWLGAADHQDSFRATKGEVLFLTSLPALSSTTSPRDTFKVIYSLLPHCYFHLKKDIVEFVQDPDPSTPNQPYSSALGNNISLEHYYTEQHTMRFLATYLDWLKAQGIYDNTKVILVSDHSWFDSRMLSDAFGGNHSYPGRPAGLLMIKDFNATGPLKISPHFLSTADVPFFACSHIGSEKCERDSSIRAYLQKVLQTDTPLDRERTHDVAEQWVLNRHPEHTLEFQTYRVRNSMFDRKNWALVPVE
jgi:hypothetical protein